MPSAVSNHITAIVDEQGRLTLLPEYIPHQVWSNVHETRIARHTRRHQ